VQTDRSESHRLHNAVKAKMTVSIPESKASTIRELFYYSLSSCSLKSSAPCTGRCTGQWPAGNDGRPREQLANATLRITPRQGKGVSPFRNAGPGCRKRSPPYDQPEIGCIRYRPHRIGRPSRTFSFSWCCRRTEEGARARPSKPPNRGRLTVCNREHTIGAKGHPRGTRPADWLRSRQPVGQSDMAFGWCEGRSVHRSGPLQPSGLSKQQFALRGCAPGIPQAVA
jgi:hypothetical protein